MLKSVQILATYDTAEYHKMSVENSKNDFIFVALICFFKVIVRSLFVSEAENNCRTNYNRIKYISTEISINITDNGVVLSNKAILLLKTCS